ncbi:hypothetical protein HHL11_23885 [Ramlibacter sp. G-1-2-2]|uniref:DUF1440 domain-containing protein n=1 Tax=Ramlibacter agri TaxID=2728837 RepID=A0A848H740_9BURK|nr:hypothetical protein [Ramlibacter agri]NML46806.1 hypothetical protein [Ramlibacter agri]
MTTWKQALREGAVSGSIAALLSSAWLAWAGHRRGHAAAPVNAVSHWFFGDRALHRDEPSVLYTLGGYLTHHSASIFWGVLHAKLWGVQHKQRLPAIAGAAAASGIACFVDYQLTPKRLTPGFEHRLAKPELANVYVFFAVGLAIGTQLMRRR